jgi:hypothetical protein
MFGKVYNMTLNRVHDSVVCNEGGERLKLIVNGDAQRMVAGLNKAQQKMKDITDESTDEEVLEVARYFASVIFGVEQAERLMSFYANDPGCVISVCSQYFTNRLAGRIAKQQKHMKV